MDSVFERKEIGFLRIEKIIFIFICDATVRYGEVHP